MKYIKKSVVQVSSITVFHNDSLSDYPLYMKTRTFISEISSTEPFFSFKATLLSVENGFQFMLVILGHEKGLRMVQHSFQVFQIALTSCQTLSNKQNKQRMLK